MGQIVTLKQFLRHFEQQRSQRFCFILGAGASRSSGIPTGAELTRQWLEHIKEDLNNDQLESWLREESIDASDPAGFYHKIFSKRFEVDLQGGYDFLEEIMENVEPSCGYSFLAEIMARGKHAIVITTNFDSLTEDALFIYTSKKPLVIGHSNLAEYINIQSQRPQVIKVHHDLFFSPQNTEDETEYIDKKLENKLREIFKSYVPIVIGYAGNDGGFMDVLKRVLDGSSGLFWCFTGKEPPEGKIEELVINKQGCFVPIEGFDELMVMLGARSGVGLLNERIEQIAKERAEGYRKQVEKVYDEIRNVEEKETDLLPGALNEILEIEKHDKPDWWIYELQARKETDPEKIASIYEEGLKKCPDSHELMNNYAISLRVKKDYSQAEKYHLRALELAPDNANINGSYAVFLRVKKDYSQAEKYYLKALELAPDNANINGNYAVFLRVKKDYSQAEKYHLKALELAPDNANINGNYVLLLLQQRHFEKAKNLIDKTFQLIQPHEKTLELELWFYRYACFYQDYPESKSQVDSLLQDGVRSPGWLLEDLLETVREMVQHPEYDQVAQFAKQICEA